MAPRDWCFNTDWLEMLFVLFVILVQIISLWLVRRIKRHSHQVRIYSVVLVIATSVCVVFLYSVESICGYPTICVGIVFSKFFLSEEIC